MNNQRVDRIFIPLLAVWCAAIMLILPLWLLSTVDAADRFKRYDMVRWANELKELNPGIVMPEIPKFSTDRDH